ncbi:hypothetical protein [Streptomyces viridosporus]|uniref:hypothetical protein n=1 Tax=Streptomyces viridosporus TaxID=67581 RepID=UPI0009BE73CF|nr:hypothetical protein [Streptomyces viridosporus]
MTTHRTGPVARLPLLAGVAFATLAALLLTLAPGFTQEVRIVPFVSVSAPAPSMHPPDTRPYLDDAYVGAGTVLIRPQRDGGERTMSAGPPLLAPPHAPRVPPRPARPAPVAGHVPTDTAHVPSDLGRAPPAASSA